ncbi:hypothetical protein [Flavobacterium sp.]|uniref:hypothetical protein n=1 Tax=Flavobacterium sp. TaxID=239 RepID=UPI0040472A33
MKKILFLACVAFQLTNAQQSKEVLKEQIATSFSNYFENNRENIHLHLNKNQFTSNENIWFKAYVINKKDEKLNPNTTNLIIRMYNDKNELIYSGLNYVANGVTNGHIPLKDNLPTGTYYIHTFTNYMNNFNENESSLFKVDIINTKDTNLKSKSKEVYSLSYNIEGGNLLYQSDNRIVVKAIDINGNGVKASNILLKNEKGDVINVIETNEQGYGFTTIINPSNEKYTLSLSSKNSTIIKNLNNVKIIGFNINANNTTNNEDLYLKIETNKISLEKNKDNYFTLAISQNGNIKFIDLNIKEKTTSLVVPKNELFEGINTLRLLDNNLNLHSERVIYNEVNKPTLTISKTLISKDSITIFGSLKNNVGNFSLSANPVVENAKTSTLQSINEQFKINSHLNEEVKNLDYYLLKTDRIKKIQFDMFLIHNKPKYNWENIKKGVPTIRYDFDLGVNLKGRIYNYDVENGKLRFISKDGIQYNVPVSENGEFEFKNLILTDSTTVFLTLLDEKERVVKTAIHSRLINNTPNFNKVINIAPIVYDNTILKEINNDVYFPRYNDIVLLNEINLSEKQEQKSQSKIRSAIDRSYKINDIEANTYRDVLMFLQTHGYNINNNLGQVNIFSRRPQTSLYGSRRAPLVFIDDAPIINFEILDGMPLNNVEEILIDNLAYEYGTRGVGSVIKIYLKKGYVNYLNVNPKTKELIIENGFKKQLAFQNLNYSNYNDAAFKNFGTIFWSPSIYTDLNGNFEVKIPTLNQEEIKVNIQGIDNEGNIYNEEQIITIE